MTDPVCNDDSVSKDSLHTEISVVCPTCDQPGMCRAEGECHYTKSPLRKINQAIVATFRAARPRPDWNRSIVGRTVWEAWNRLDSTIFGLTCAQTPDISAAHAAVNEARLQMVSSLRDRDAGHDRLDVKDENRRSNTVEMTDYRLGKMCGLCQEPLKVLWLYGEPIGLGCPKHINEWASDDD